MRTSRYLGCRAAILCLIITLGLAALPGVFAKPIPQQPAPQTGRRNLPPPQYIPSRDYQTRNIKLDLRFDWEREQAYGAATISFAPLVTDLRRAVFDAGYMTFSTISLASGAPLKYEYDGPKEKLTINLDRAYQPSDQITVVIAYHTNSPPAGRRGFLGGGLRFIKPRPEDPTRSRQVWTQGEPEFNHLWFPCYDHPNDFATSEVVATVEKPLVVISNGRLAQTKDNKDGTRTFDWKMEQPHASYLTSIIVGEYKSVTASYAGIPIVTNVYPAEFEEGKVTAARLAEMVQFFSEKTGVKYPYAKYAQTTVRDFGGGMENISATTQTDNMIHDARTELDQTSDGLQSHELAHQWFGDYVTCRSWADIWLNESFATYFQAMWDERHLGRDDFLYLDVKGNQDAYYRAWAQGNRRPIVTKNYAGPDAVFDVYAYPRGGAVLHMLRKILGEESWWRAINHYLRKYAHQPVETEQFRIAIEEATGQPMDWFFDEWVYKMGHPVFKVTQDYDATAKTLTLKVKQEQKPDPDSPYPQAGLFQTPLEIEIGTAKGTRIERVQIKPREEQTFKFTVDSEPLLVNFDYGSTLIKELQFEKTLGQVLYQLVNDQDVLGRMWALHWLAGRMGGESIPAAEKQSIRKAISNALVQDKSWGMRLEAATDLNGLADEAVRTALVAATKDPNARVRARAVASLATTQDPKRADLYVELLTDYSYGVIRAAALALGQTKSEKAYDALVRLMDTLSWRDNMKVSALSGLAALGDKRALDLGFRYAAAGNSPAVQAAALAIVGSLGAGDQRAFPLISNALREAFSRRNIGFFGAAAEALVSLGDERALALFEELRQKAADNARAAGMIMQYEMRLKQAVKPGSAKP